MVGCRRRRRHHRWVFILSQQVHYTRIRPTEERPSVRPTVGSDFMACYTRAFPSFPSFLLSFLLTLMMLKTEPGGRIDYSERKWENRRRRPKLASKLHSALPDRPTDRPSDLNGCGRRAVHLPKRRRKAKQKRPSLLYSPLLSTRSIDEVSYGSRDKLSPRRSLCSVTMHERSEFV